jgi:hypothetical protein
MPNSFRASFFAIFLGNSSLIPSGTRQQRTRTDLMPYHENLERIRINVKFALFPNLLPPKVVDPIRRWQENPAATT